MTHTLSQPGLTRRAPLLGFIVLMHVAFIYLVNTGLRIELPKFVPPIELVPIAAELTRPVEPLRSPVEPVAMPNDLTVQPPELDLPVEPLTEPPQAITPDYTASDTGGSAAVAGDTLPALDRRRPIGQPPYPPQSIRLEQQGLVRITACVQPDGRLTGLALATSSGYALLDEAALKHLRKPSIRLRPGTRDGRPVAMCTAIPVRFDIRNR